MSQVVSPPSSEPTEPRSGTSRGLNVRDGDGDDGWVPPPAVDLADGTRIRLYKDGQALAAAYEAIAAARRLICLEVYIFADDDTGRAFADLLAARARHGLRVHVIYDSFGSINSDREMFARMRRSGVRLREFHPMRPWETRFSWRPFNRDHRKLLVIDREIAGIGGLNIGRDYGGSSVVHRRGGPECRAWRDNAVGIVGPAAEMFHQAFARSWNYATHGGRIRGAEFRARLDDGELGVLASVPALDSPLGPMLCRLMRGARRTILMTMAYFAPDEALIHELCRAAHRGVRVRLMLPELCDVPVMRLAARSFYERLLGCGIEIHERRGVMLHAKTMVIDEQVVMMGSTNLDYRSIEYNCEISAVIRSREFGRQMCELFENDVLFAHRIVPGEWRRRPMRDRLVQWSVSRLRRWL